MLYEFTSNDNSHEMKDIIQCLTNLFNIPRGSIPLSRGMGMNWRFLSQIPPDLENDMATDLIEQVAEYESRVAVSEVVFENVEGTTTVGIVLEKGEDYGGQ